MIEALSEWNKLPDVYSFFVNRKPIVTVYQDKIERSDFLRTQKPMKPNQAQFQGGFQGAMRTPFGMGSMSLPQMINPMGMNPMSMPQLGMNSMGMPQMGMGNPYFNHPGNPSNQLTSNIPTKMNVAATK